MSTHVDFLVGAVALRTAIAALLSTWSVASAVGVARTSPWSCLFHMMWAVALLALMYSVANVLVTKVLIRREHQDIAAPALYLIFAYVNCLDSAHPGKSVSASAVSS